jgi:hypothetical protein
MRTPHKGTLWGELSRYFGEEIGVAGENAGTGAKLPQFDNTPGTRKHSATELFNERHGLSAFFCSGFLAGCRLMRRNIFSAEALCLLTLKTTAAQLSSR